MHYCEWFHSSVNGGLIDPQLLFFSDEAWFHLSGTVGTGPLKIYIAFEKSLIMIGKFVFWCAVSARLIIGLESLCFGELLVLDS